MEAPGNVSASFSMFTVAGHGVNDVERLIGSFIGSTREGKENFLTDLREIGTVG
jgi:hypothetical protein